MVRSEQPKVRYLYLVLGFAFYMAFLIIYVNGSYPYIGHDYRYFLSRILDVQIHIRENGFVLQWFTPSFGGGIPAYFNPQHTQFTLAQLLTLTVSPWTAMLISMGVFSAIGFVASYQFGREILEESWQAAVLGALFFTTSGFYIERMAAGHFGYQPFPLTAAIFYLLFSRKFHLWIRGLLIGLCITIMVFNGGFYLVVFLGFIFLLLLPLVLLLNGSNVFIWRMLFTGLIGGGTAGLFSAGKIYAVLKFIGNFPRLVDISHYNSLAEAIIGFGLQFAGVPLLLLPYVVFRGGAQSFLLMMLNRQAKSGRYGLWELDSSLSPIFFLVVAWFGILFLVHFWDRINQENGPIRLTAQQKLYLGFLLVSVYITFEFTTARGFTYNLLKDLPIFQSLHTVRGAVSLVLPGAMLGGFLVEKIFEKLPNSKSMAVFTGLFLGILAGLSLYFLLPLEQTQNRNIDVGPVYQISERISQGENFSVTRLVLLENDLIQEVQVFEQNASSLRTYEPIFGYDLREFKTTLSPGSIFLQQEGKFNMHDPRSMILGEEDFFSRFTLDEKEMMTAFANYQQPDWDLPEIFYALNNLSLITLLLALTAISLYFLRILLGFTR